MNYESQQLQTSLKQMILKCNIRICLWIYCICCITLYSQYMKNFELCIFNFSLFYKYGSFFLKKPHLCIQIYFANNASLLCNFTENRSGLTLYDCTYFNRTCCFRRIHTVLNPWLEKHIHTPVLLQNRIKTKQATDLAWFACL